MNTYRRRPQLVQAEQLTASYTVKVCDHFKETYPPGAWRIIHSDGTIEHCHDYEFVERFEKVDDDEPIPNP